MELWMLERLFAIHGPNQISTKVALARDIIVSRHLFVYQIILNGYFTEIDMRAALVF